MRFWKRTNPMGYALSKKNRLLQSEQAVFDFGFEVSIKRCDEVRDRA